VRRKNNGWMMVRECLYVVTFVKPGVEAFRVASGQEELPGAACSPLEEMAYSKCAELFCEAAPGMVLQCAAFITSEKKTASAVTSILISAGCAAMTATTLAYDLDTSPKLRMMNPLVCGMIPDTGRGLAFAVMFSISFLQVTAKCVSVALLAVTEVSWLVYYLAGDMALYLLQKILRRDFIYQVPLPLSVAVPASFVERVVSKTVIDFTGCMILRVPVELGGAYYSFNLGTTIISVPVVAYLYQEYAKEEDGVKKLSAMVLWTFSIGIALSWAVMFGYFMARIIVPKYRESFWSTQTGWERAEKVFLDVEEDEKRAFIFMKNIVMWSRIKADVKAWTMGNWETWDREKPEWFTNKFVASVPDEFIPPKFLTTLGAARMRRGSAAGSIRESLIGEGAD
jgi:hypothetical protein